VSIQESRKAAYVGSFALVASHMAVIAPEICQPQNLLKWDTYRQCAALFEEFQRNPLLKLEDTDPASVFHTAQHKLQHKAANTEMSRDRIEMMHLPIPGAGPACSFGATNTLGWLYANPAFFQIGSMIQRFKSLLAAAICST
jgi:hypothetical protein